MSSIAIAIDQKRHFINTGEEVGREQAVDYDPKNLSPQAREWVFQHGALPWDINTGVLPSEATEALALARIEAAAQAWNQAQEEERSRIAAQEVADRAMNLKCFLNNDNIWDKRRYRSVDLGDLHPDDRELPEVRAEVERRRQAQDARAAAQEKRAREEAEAEQRRADQLASWVREHGTTDQRERLEAGALPDDEVINAIRDRAFAPLAGWPRYEKLSRRDVCDCGSDVSFDAEDVERFSPEQWAARKAVLALVPAAEITLRRHVANCDSCNESAIRYSLRVAVQVGELRLSREYSDEPPETVVLDYRLPPELVADINAGDDEWERRRREPGWQKQARIAAERAEWHLATSIDNLVAEGWHWRAAENAIHSIFGSAAMDADDD